jgi:hypothetical protein
MISKIFSRVKILFSKLFLPHPSNFSHSRLDGRTVDEIEDDHWIG